MAYSIILPALFTRTSLVSSSFSRNHPTGHIRQIDKSKEKTGDI